MKKLKINRYWYLMCIAIWNWRYKKQIEMTVKWSPMDSAYFLSAIGRAKVSFVHDALYVYASKRR